MDLPWYNGTMLVIEFVHEETVRKLAFRNRKDEYTIPSVTAMVDAAE